MDLDKEIKSKQQQHETVQKTLEAYNKEIQEREIQRVKLQNALETIDIQFKNIESKIADLNREYQEKQQMIADIEKSAEKAFDEKTEWLEKDFNRRKQEIENQVSEYSKLFEEEKAKLETELQILKDTRDAAVEAWRKEEEIKANQDYYRLDIAEDEQQDIALLENIKTSFSHPRVIAKLIWQSYYQPLAKKKFPMIIGEHKTGIYKITNTQNTMCYIGQCVDFYKRWCDHAKFACGLDTPTNNKLYKAMRSYGLDNFTFEVLQECSNGDLDKTEAYYIELYNSVNFGYNSKKQ